MAYEKQTWVDYPDISSPITAERLNHMEDGIEGAWEHGGGTGGTLPTASIQIYAGSTDPEGWLICDGREVSRTTYSDLFNVIGTTYGVGDGTSTFNIPNLKGKTIIGVDSTDEDFDTLGATGGEKEHTLTVAEMPAHTHNNSPTGRATSVNGGSAHSISVNDNTGIVAPYQTGNRGGGQPHNILQPYMVLNYIISY